MSDIDIMYKELSDKIDRIESKVDEILDAVKGPKVHFDCDDDSCGRFLSNLNKEDKK